MARYILAIFGMLICMQAYAQPVRLKSVVTYEEKDDQLVIFDSTELKYRAGNLYEGRLANYQQESPYYDTADRWLANASGLALGSQTMYYYNALNKVDTANEHTYETGVVRTPLQLYYRYDAAGNDTLQMASFWDVNGLKWDTLWCRIKRYAGGKLSELEDMEYAVGVWTPNVLTKYTYQGSNLHIEEQQSWNDVTHVWAPERRNIHIYDAAGNMVNDSFKSWNSVTNNWEDESAATYTYNTANKQLTYSLNRWDAPNAVWFPAWRTESTYNAAGLQDTIKYEMWDVIAAAYTPGNKAFFTYTAAGLMDTFTSQTYNAVAGVYENKARNCYQYNTLNLKTQNTYQLWAPATGRWKDKFQYRFYYTAIDTATAIAPLLPEAAAIQLYPNPTSDFITLTIDNKQSSTIAIYNTTGALLRQWEEKSGITTRTIPLHGFANGNYILTVRGTDGSKVSKQFVVGR